MIDDDHIFRFLQRTAMFVSVVMSTNSCKYRQTEECLPPQFEYLCVSLSVYICCMCSLTH